MVLRGARSELICGQKTRQRPGCGAAYDGRIVNEAGFGQRRERVRDGFEQPLRGAFGFVKQRETLGGRLANRDDVRQSVRLVREALPHMRAARWGRICCITSYTVTQAAPVLALSNTARTGLWAWIKTAASDLASESSGITLNMACPGPHATDRMKQLGGTGVMGDPEDFGAVVAFLCSSQAGFVNGSAVVVDGGATLAL